MSVEAYLQETEPAVRHLFKGLDLYDTIRPPSITQYVDDTGHVKMSKKEADDVVKISLESFALEFSRATLAGAILQIAYVGLKEHSINKSVTPLCEKFGIIPGMPLAKFCVGRTRFEIPMGLLIYSGRIQYNHWEDGWNLRSVPKNVFRHLIYSYYDNLTFDMAYELEFPSTRPVSHYIVRIELKWITYDHYLEDMKAMLLHD